CCPCPAFLRRSSSCSDRRTSSPSLRAIALFDKGLDPLTLEPEFTPNPDKAQLAFAHQLAHRVPMHTQPAFGIVHPEQRFHVARIHHFLSHWVLSNTIFSRSAKHSHCGCRCRISGSSTHRVHTRKRKFIVCLHNGVNTKLFIAAVVEVRPLLVNSAACPLVSVHSTHLDAREFSRRAASAGDTCGIPRSASRRAAASGTAPRAGNTGSAR